MHCGDLNRNEVQKEGEIYKLLFSCSVLTNYLQTHRLQLVRLPCPTISWSLLKLRSIESVMPLCHPLLLLPSVFPSIKVFSSESALLIRWPNYWSFSTSPSNEYSELISFWMNCFDILAVQGILKSLLQPHNSEASIFWCSVFFMV